MRVKLCFSLFVIIFSIFSSQFVLADENIGCVLVLKDKDDDPVKTLSTITTEKTCNEYVDNKNNELDTLEKITDSRLVTSPRQKIMVHLIGDAICGSKVQFNEVKRKSTIEKDGEVLVKIITKIMDAQAACDPLVTTESYILKKKRAELQITITKQAPLVAKKAAAPAPAPANDSVSNEDSNASAPTKSSEKDEIKFVLTTGPKEHFFLSADMIVNSIDELKYDPETKTLSEKDKPTKYYLGLNYMIGDVLADYSGSTSWIAPERFFGKVMLQLDNNPTDSYGLGIGYRPEFIESVSIYAAYMVFKEDKLKDGTLQENKGRNEEVVFGISFNLDKALGWLSK